MQSLALTLERVISVLSQEIIDPVIKLLIALAALVFMWGVIQFVLSADAPEQRDQGKKHMVWGIIGLVIMVSAFGIINLIISSWDSLDAGA